LSTHDEAPRDAGNRYVEYLDKEMTIMGILSTFCMVVVGGCATLLSDVAKEQHGWFTSFWHAQGPFILCGSAAIVLSAFLFYRQRSLLSYCVGQIHLSSKYQECADGSPRELHERANSWKTWRYYRLAFICLFTAAAYLTRVTLMYALETGDRFLRFLAANRTWELWAPAILCLILCVSVCMAFDAFPFDDHPYRKSWGSPSKFLRGFKSLFTGGLE
jgi:hypothetical protein